MGRRKLNRQRCGSETACWSGESSDADEDAEGEHVSAEQRHVYAQAPRKDVHPAVLRINCTECLS